MVDKYELNDENLGVALIGSDSRDIDEQTAEAFGELVAEVALGLGIEFTEARPVTVNEGE